jgi:hypothetical protein
LLALSEDSPAFYEEGLNIVALPAAVAAWTVVGRYIIVHQDVVIETEAGGTDLVLNPTWYGEVVDRMVGYVGGQTPLSA